MSEFESRDVAGDLGDCGELTSPTSSRTLATLRRIFSFVLIVLTAIWLYRRALTFAFFNDDPTGHFAWMEGQSLLHFFTGSADYGYYRPVVFAVLRLMELLFGSGAFPHNPVADHALLLFLHGVNAALVWTLARRLGGSDAFAWVAALVFAFVPFSYEAVAYVASLTHPLLVFWVLVALLLFDSGRQRVDVGKRRRGESGEQVGQNSMIPSRWFMIGSGAAMVMGLLTHENGLFTFPALAGMDWATRPRITRRERAYALWPFGIPPVLFAALWLVIPKNSVQGLNGATDIGRNIVPFLETLIYPLLPVARLDATDVWMLLLLAAGVVGLFGLMALRAGAVRLWAFALGWFALAALPALLFLSPAYVYGSPRLSYLPSIGAALLWAIPILWLKNRVFSEKPGFDKRTAIMVALTIVYTVALILPPLPFIRCQLDFYAETSRFAREMASAAADAPAGRHVVFINTPFFFSSITARPVGCPSPYPWTPVGGILIPPYAQARDFVRFNGGPNRSVTGVTYPGYDPGWRTFGVEIDDLTLRRHAAEDAAYVFDLLSGSFINLPAVWQPGAGAAASPLASFGNTLTLTAVELTQKGNWLTASLAWRVLTPKDTPLAAFVHIYDATGALVAQSDSPPGAGFVPWDLWQPGDGLADERRIDLTTLPPGAYRVAVGVYRPTDGVRLAAETEDQPLSDNVFPVQIIER